MQNEAEKHDDSQMPFWASLWYILEHHGPEHEDFSRPEGFKNQQKFTKKSKKMTSKINMKIFEKRDPGIRGVQPKNDPKSIIPKQSGGSFFRKN